nr:hypothetical protein [Actinosynnema pretiosum]
MLVGATPVVVVPGAAGGVVVNVVGVVVVVIGAGAGAVGGGTIALVVATGAVVVVGAAVLDTGAVVNSGALVVVPTASVVVVGALSSPVGALGAAPVVVPVVVVPPVVVVGVTASAVVVPTTGAVVVPVAASLVVLPGVVPPVVVPPVVVVVTGPSVVVTAGPVVVVIVAVALFVVVLSAVVLGAAASHPATTPVNGYAWNSLPDPTLLLPCTADPAVKNRPLNPGTVTRVVLSAFGTSTLPWNSDAPSSATLSAFGKFHSIRCPYRSIWSRPFGDPDQVVTCGAAPTMLIRMVAPSGMSAKPIPCIPPSGAAMLPGTVNTCSAEWPSPVNRVDSSSCVTVPFEGFAA